jgi:hypothetical protein
MPQETTFFYPIGEKCGLVLCPLRFYQLGATAGLSGSAGNMVGQANRGTRKLCLDKALALRPSQLHQLAPKAFLPFFNDLLSFHKRLDAGQGKLKSHRDYDQSHETGDGVPQ